MDVSKERVLNEDLIDILDDVDLDGLSGTIPIAQTFNFFLKKLQEIKDPHDAMIRIMSHVMSVAAHNGCIVNNISISIPVKSHEQSFVEAFKGVSLPDIFEVDKFVSNPLLQAGLKHYSQHLRANQVSEHMLAQFKRYFTDHTELYFFEVLETSKNTYKNLITQLESHFAQLDFELKKLEFYRSKLSWLFNEPISLGPVGGKIPLSEVYVEPSFQVFSGSLDENYTHSNTTPFTDIRDEEKFQYSVHNLVEQFLQDRVAIPGISRGDLSTLIIAGEPGQGKTSVSKKILHDIVTGQSLFQGQCFLIKLIDIIDKARLTAYPFHEFKHMINHEVGRRLRFERFERPLFILEGLDELAVKHNISNKDLTTLCQQLIHEAVYKRYKVIITTRDRYLEFRDFGNIDSALIVKLKPFSIVKQQAWLAKYQRFVTVQHVDKAMIDEVNSKLELEPVRQLFEMPILLTIICGLDAPIKEFKTRIEVYESLFDTIISQKHSRSAESKFSAHDRERIEEKKKEILTILMHVALASYKSARGYLSTQDLDEVCSEVNIPKGEILKKIQDVLVHFYFTQSKDSSGSSSLYSYSVEFLHSTFKEYLYAKCIFVRAKEVLLTSFQNDHTLLTYFNTLFGDRALSYGVVSYLHEIMRPEIRQSYLSATEVVTMREKLEKMLPKLLDRDFYTHDAKGGWSIQRSRNIFLGMWTLLSNLLDRSNLTLAWEKRTIEQFIYYLRIGEYTGLDLSYFKFGLTDFSLNFLNEFDLTGSDFTDAFLTGSSMRGCNLTGATLVGTDFRRVDLTGSIFTGADLTGANFRWATLYNVSFDDVKTTKGAKFRTKLSEEQKIAIRKKRKG